MGKAHSACDGPGCPALLAIEMIGSELKLVVLHSLLSGPKRFNELREAADMCQSSLAKTLKDLEEAGIAERHVILERPVAVEYRLSAMGQDLFEAIRGLERWSHRWFHETRSGKVHA
ncbi:MAG TPA: helix-turn-helix domain-containing protein [Thermoplasmata archaeon]|nr:helix-turn-helix domain-containing protein [Thermoplasmata archaeon]